MGYRALEPITKEEAMDIFSDPNVGEERLSEIIFRAVRHVDDCAWINESILGFLARSQPRVRRAAIVCSGDICRLYGTVDFRVLDFLRGINPADGDF